MTENTESPRKCPQCDGEMIRHAEQEFCPACLLQQGMRSSTMAGPRFSWTPPTPEELADRFTGLEIQGLLGQGGMGAVYRVRQTELDRIAALKILPEQVAQEPGFAERFLREARLLASLSHPHIVTVYEFGQREGTFFLLMEFVDGVTLRQALRSEPIHRLDPREALTVVGQLCDALQFAHDEGVIHRDIKPENILIDKRGRVKIADFGLARMLGTSAGMLTLTGTNQMMGTPIYMAPEQIEGTGAVDHRVDIYSMGVVFYELLTGELPIGRFSPPSRRTELDKGLDEVVLRALEKEPERRYQQASEIRTAVAPFNGTSSGQSAKSKQNERRIGGAVRTFATFAAGAIFVLILPGLISDLQGMLASSRSYQDPTRIGNSNIALPEKYTESFGMGMENFGDDSSDGGMEGGYASPMDSAMGEEMESRGYESGSGGMGFDMDSDMASHSYGMSSGGMGVGAGMGGSMMDSEGEGYAEEDMMSAMGGEAGGMSGSSGMMGGMGLGDSEGEGDDSLVDAADSGFGGSGLGSSGPGGAAGMGMGFGGDEGAAGDMAGDMGGGGNAAGFGGAGGMGLGYGGEAVGADEEAAGGFGGMGFGGEYPDSMAKPVPAWLKIDAGQVTADLTPFSKPHDDLTELDEILTEFHQRYLELESLYSTIHRIGTDTVTEVIVDAEQQRALINAMWTRLDDTVSRAHQRELRQQLPLYSFTSDAGGSDDMGYPGGMGGYPGGGYPGLEGAGGFSGNAAWLPGLFGWDSRYAPCIVRVGHEGRWYIWSVSMSEIGMTSGKGPELPAELVRFDREFIPSTGLGNLRALCHGGYSSTDRGTAQHSRQRISQQFTHRGRISAALSIFTGEAISDSDEAGQLWKARMEHVTGPATAEGKALNLKEVLTKWPEVRSKEDLAQRVELIDELTIAVPEEGSTLWLDGFLNASDDQPPILALQQSDGALLEQAGPVAAGWLNPGSDQQVKVRLKLQRGTWLIDELILAPGLTVEAAPDGEISGAGGDADAE